MAKLSNDEWSAVRERWESDPRPGYTWIVKELKLPVTHVAVHKRSHKETWAKRLSLKTIVERAQMQADQEFTRFSACKLTAAVNEKRADLLNVLSEPDASVDLRACLLETHRNEWSEHRNRYTPEVWRSVRMEFELAKQDHNADIDQPLLPDAPSDFGEFMRTAKTAAEVLRLRQDGERKAWGLDVHTEEQTAGMDNIELLEARMSAAMKQSKEMQIKLRREREKLYGKTIN